MAAPGVAVLPKFKIRGANVTRIDLSRGRSLKLKPIDNAGWQERLFIGWGISASPKTFGIVSRPQGPVCIFDWVDSVSGARGEVARAPYVDNQAAILAEQILTETRRLKSL